MATVTWSLLADFNGDGVYEFDLTPYIDRPSHNIRVSRGISRDGKPQVSKLSISLTNRDGTFTPENSASSLYGKIRPGVPVQLSATHLAAPYTNWTGYIIGTEVGWAVGEDPICRVECADIFYFLKDAALINTTSSTTRTTNTALDAVADQVGLTAGDKDFDTGAQSLGQHFAVGQNPLEAMLAVAASEMGGLLYAGADGKVRFESRNSRLGVASVADTWGDGTSVVPYRIGYRLTDDDMATQVTARAVVFRQGQDGIEVFRISQDFAHGDALSLTAGQVWQRDFNLESAVVAFTTPVASTDYRANSAQNGSGTDLTSSLSVTATPRGAGQFTLTLRNTGGSTLYYELRLRGQPVEFYADRAQAQFTQTVNGLKAGRGQQYDVPFSGDTGQKLRDFAYQELRVGRYPWPTLELSFRPLFDAEHTAMLGVDLGDRIRFTDLAGAISESSRTDGWYYVEALEYSLGGEWFGETYEVKVTLIPSYVYRRLDSIVFDVFTRPDRVGSLGTSFSDDAWANDSGFNLTSNQAIAASDALQMPNLDLGASRTDQVVEVIMSAIGVGDEVGVVLGYIDANNQYRVYVDKGDNAVHFEKNVAGVVSDVITPAAFTVGTTHEIRVFRRSTRFEVWVDQRKYADTTDSSLTTGTKVGLFARNANGSTAFTGVYGQAMN